MSNDANSESSVSAADSVGTVPITDYIPDYLYQTVCHHCKCYNYIAHYGGTYYCFACSTLNNSQYHYYRLRVRSDTNPVRSNDSPESASVHDTVNDPGTEFEYGYRCAIDAITAYLDSSTLNQYLSRLRAASTNRS